MKAWLHSFLTSALSRGEGSTPRPSCFAPGIFWQGGWMGPKFGLDELEKRNVSCPCRVGTPDRPARSLVSSCASWHVNWLSDEGFIEKLIVPQPVKNNPNCCRAWSYICGEEGMAIVRNVGIRLPINAASHPRRNESSGARLRKRQNSQPEGSSQCSQQPVTGHYLEPHETKINTFSPHFQDVF